MEPQSCNSEKKICVQQNEFAASLYEWSIRLCRQTALLLMVLATSLISTAEAATPSFPYRLLDSREQGAFNIGPSQGTVNRSFDEDIKKDVLNFSYSAPKGSVVGIWTKNYPPELAAPTVNAVTIGVKIPASGQIDQISAAVEIKGKKDVQKIPLQLRQGWNSIQESIEWDRIGDLNEVVLVICPLGTNELAVGTMSFNLDFVKLDLPPKSRAPTAVVSPRTANLPAGHPVQFSILDAGERGIFNIGPAKGDVSCITDTSVNKDVLKLDYSAPTGTVIGVWTKKYSPELRADAVNAARVGVKTLNSSQMHQVSVAVEIKGAKDVQRIPLKLQEGWNSVQESIDWDKIGDLNEVVLVVNPMPGNALTTGTLFFDVDFVKQKSSGSAAQKIGVIFAISVFLALMTALLGRLFAPRRKDSSLKPCEESKRHASLETSVSSRIKRDFSYGTATVLIAGVVLGIYLLGTKSTFQTGYSFLAIAIMGAVIAELLKSGLTGKHLTPAEVFQNLFLTGLLAATSSGQVLLQAPANWTQVLLKSNLTAALACLLYHFANACSLASTGRHLKAIQGTLIVGTPYLFGWLLILENVNLLQSLGNGVTGGLLSSWPVLTEALGRIIVVFGFNEAFTNEISLATRGKALNTFKAHLFAFLVSLAVVISPDIANLGSTAAVASLPIAIRSIVAVLTSMFSQAGLWAEVYLITGIFLDGIHGTAPSRENIYHHVTTGARKGMAYSGIFMAILYLLYLLLQSPFSQTIMASLPIVVGILFGALVFPFAKTLIETFDGSQAFFERMRYSYRNVWLYTRGAVVGFGLAYGITYQLYQWELSDRVPFGLFIGLLASAGVSILRDVVYASKGRGRIQSWRLYFIDALLGGFVGSALAFYLDHSQVPVVIEKFKLYTSAGLSPKAFTTYPLVSKWGRIDLGAYSGGVKMFFNEALAGVINWAVAAWLFAINRAFMEAYFHKDSTPIKHFFSKAGFVDLSVNMIQVLRWGLWMSPIINTFLRMMSEATWYNQDGAIRTLFAIYHHATMSPADFQAWSLKIFVYLLAYDIVRVLIWIDHMGLRVATLVNLSFIGMNKLDERMARFIGPAAAQRYIPEAVKRFTTWAPLLIPFYIPRGPAWDYAWSTAEAIQNAAQEGGILSVLCSLAFTQKLLLGGSSILVCTVISFIIRTFTLRSARLRERVFELNNREYKVVLKESGEGYSQIVRKGYDVSRRSYDTMDPCGRVLYLVDTSQKPADASRSWPVIGNFPKEDFEASDIEENDGCLCVINTANGIRTKIQIHLPDPDSAAELWTVTVDNLTDKSRRLKVIPYLEWVLDRSGADRGHTQYARLFPVMEYASGVNAILTWQKNTKAMGILASDAPPDGFLTSRMDFIGRARSIWAPRVLETLHFLDARDTSAHPTFDPIGSLMVDAAVDPKGSRTVRFLIGYARNKEAALELIHKHLQPKTGVTESSAETKKRSPLIGHGEIPPGTPQPYSEFTDHGNKLLIHTPYTPRPYDHALSNALGQYVTVTNRGLHTSSNGNSQQNRLTPDWPDTVTREVPAEAIYLYDPEKEEWYSPTHHPLNDYSAKNE
jgi:cyclic beta-1,2-glucan synthetase